jgi:hypothetical protein
MQCCKQKPVAAGDRLCAERDRYGPAGVDGGAVPGGAYDMPKIPLRWITGSGGGSTSATGGGGGGAGKLSHFSE